MNSEKQAILSTWTLVGIPFEISIVPWIEHDADWPLEPQNMSMDMFRAPWKPAYKSRSDSAVRLRDWNHQSIVVECYEAWGAWHNIEIARNMLRSLLFSHSLRGTFLSRKPKTSYMGHRACFILINNEKERTFYYSRYGSTILDHNILGGFRQLVSFIEDQDCISETEWLSLGGGQDGGLLLDFQQRVLIWYGEEKTDWDSVYRGVFLNVARQLWVDWDLRWAYNHAHDILNYAGYPMEPLYLDDFNQVPRIHLDPARDGSIKESLLGILSIIDSAQQCRLIPLDQPVYSYLLSGPAFFSNWKEVPQLENLLINTIPIPFYEEAEPNVPQGCGGGIHLNFSEQKLDYWEKSPNLGIEQLIFPMWPGWQITIHYDEFEWQEKITNGALSFKVKSKSEILAEMLPLGVWSKKPKELDDQEIEEMIAKLVIRPYGPALFVKIMVYLILVGVLILFLWVLMG